MLKRLLSLILILTLICVELPVAIAETIADEMPAVMDAVAEDIPLEEGEDNEPEAVEPEPVSFKRGDRDSDDSTYIVAIQNRLIELGYLRDAADGVFGANTEDAISALQRSNGLAETGEVDSALLEQLTGGAEFIHASESMDPESITYRVQDKLAQWGFLMDDPDGQAGSKTGEAVAVFKKYLRSYLRNHPTPAPENTPEPTLSTGFGDAAVAVDSPIDKAVEQEITQDVLDFVDGKYDFEVYTKTVSNGDEGDEVLRIQRRLLQLNYLAIADGAFGPTTERALLYFQKKNGLTQSAVADETTQRLLFSEAAVESEEYVNAYKIVIDISDQRVYVYQWNGSDYGTCVGEMICSTGKNATPTPLGTYQAAGPTGSGEWYWFSKYECYAKWATRIVGGILFHSVTYSKGKRLNQTSVRKLGRKASHGCVRLKVEHAKWIYENCTAGTTVVVQE